MVVVETMFGANEKSRSEKRSEKYYARNNDPSYPQFAHQTFHFVDAARRQYMIAAENHAPFNNTRFKPNRQRGSDLLRCQVNSDGQVKLFVRLPRQSEHWFATRDLNQPLELIRKDRPEERFLVRLRQAIKPSRARRTGTIFVSSLSQTYCNQLLNLVVPPQRTTTAAAASASQNKRSRRRPVLLSQQPPVLQLL